MGCATSRCAENPVANLAVGAYASARDNDVEAVRAALDVMDVDAPDKVRLLARGGTPRRGVVRLSVAAGVKLACCALFRARRGS